MQYIVVERFIFYDSKYCSYYEETWRAKLVLFYDREPALQDENLDTNIKHGTSICVLVHAYAACIV